MKNNNRYYRFSGTKEAAAKYPFSISGDGYYSEDITFEGNEKPLSFWVDMYPEDWEEEPEGIKHFKGFLKGIGNAIIDHEQRLELEEETNEEVGLIIDYSMKLIEKFNPPGLDATDEERTSFALKIINQAQSFVDVINIVRQDILSEKMKKHGYAEGSD